MEVCQLAAQEQDVKKMLDLTGEMLRLLDEESASAKKNGSKASDIPQEHCTSLMVSSSSSI